MTKTKVAVLGGGNGAHAAAADLTLRGFEVHMYEDERFAGRMKKVFNTKQIKISGVCGDDTVSIAMVTTDLKVALDGVRYILVVVPAFAHKEYAEKLVNVIQPGQVVFLLPGTFGSLIFWKTFQKVKNDIVIAETDTLPYAARLTGEGEVRVMNRFNPLKVGVIPASKTDKTVQELSQFFDGLKATENIVACGLSSMNPVLHVPGCILNAGRIEYAKGEFFCYTEGFTHCVARTTEVVDKERIALLEQFGYKWDILAHTIRTDITTNDLYEAVAEHPTITKIKGPADLKNRYYSEDIPYGIAIWAKLAKSIGVETPMMDSMVHIGSAIMEQNCWTSGHSLKDLGIDGMDIERLKEYLETGE